MKRISAKKYYETMSSFEQCSTIDEIESKWKECFVYMVINRDETFTRKQAENIFNEMEVGLSSNETKDLCQIMESDGPMEYLRSFASECYYISDRSNFDRIFYAHRLFLSLKYKWKYGDNE